MRSQEADKQVNLLQHGVIETGVSKVLRGGDEKTFISAVMERAEVERIRSGDDVALSLGSTGAIIRETLACRGSWREPRHRCAWVGRLWRVGAIDPFLGCVVGGRACG